MRRLGDRERVWLRPSEVRGRGRRAVLTLGVASIGCLEEDDAAVLAVEAGCGLDGVGGAEAGACSSGVWGGAWMCIFGREGSKIGRWRGLERRRGLRLLERKPRLVGT